MRVTRAPDGKRWVVTDIPQPFYATTDEYDTKAEAEADRRGMEAYFKYMWPKIAKHYQEAQ